MAQLIHYTTCPVCDGSHLKEVFSIKDYTVSKEFFTIVECSTCSLRFTQDVPGSQSINSYYKSEEYISHTDTSKGLINKVYKQVRQITLKQKARQIEKFSRKKKGTLLEIGSGTGTFASYMQQRGWEVTGLEPDMNARKVAADLYNAELKPADNLYQLKSSSFDVIVMWHVLEHVHELHQYLKQITGLLKEGGKLFIAVPNYTAVDADIYKEYWAAYDVPRHLYHFSPGAISKLMELHQLHVLAYQPMWFDSFYISLLSSRYKNGKTSWLPAIVNGFRSNMHALFNNKKCSSVTYIIEK
jgi:2-polyprenyl-3-methyl-5-hydroxy-6-metoxy-1,4-benzoquinol methylase